MPHSTNATDKPTAQHAAARRRAAALLVASLLAVAALAGCGRPAATVDGIDIKEEDVTAQIEALREQSCGGDEESWARYLIQSDMTPEQLREYVIGLKVESILIEEHAPELGINVANEDVQKLYDESRASFSDDEWKAYLGRTGLTDEAYRASLREYLAQEAVHEHFQDAAEYSEADVEEAARYYLSAYGGTKRVEEAVVPIGDPTDPDSIATAEELAREIHKMATDGGMSLEEAAKAADPDGAAGVIYVGPDWGIIEARGDEFAARFSNVGVGQVAEPSTGIASVEVFKVIGELPQAGQDRGLGDLPADIREQVRQITRSNAAGTSFQAWYKEIWDKSAVRVNPAPSPLPYDVDLEKYREKVEAELAGRGDGQ